MKIGELIDYLHSLETISVADMLTVHQLRMQEVYVTTCYHPRVTLESFTEQIEANRDNIDQAYQALEQTIQDLRIAVQAEIQAQQREYYRKCLDWWLNSERKLNSTLSAINRRPVLDTKQIDLIRARILKYQDWRWPGLIIRPGHERFVDDMVSFDPLYLIDTTQELLQPALGRFNPVYQNRLCCYEVDEQFDTAFLGQLPQGQFGFVFAFYFFEFRPLQLLERWLANIWALLRPGGQFFFTYNDCDRRAGIAAHESSRMAYTPGGEVMLLVQSLGFEILDQYIGEDISWMHIARPGSKISLRGSQTLAKVIVESK